MNETKKEKKRYSHTYSTRNFKSPLVVQEDNFDGWSECDVCYKELNELDTVYTHWHTVRKVYYTDSKTPYTKETFKFFRDYDRLPTMFNDYDNFLFLTCSKRCSNRHK